MKADSKKRLQLTLDLPRGEYNFNSKFVLHITFFLKCYYYFHSISLLSQLNCIKTYFLVIAIIIWERKKKKNTRKKSKRLLDYTLDNVSLLTKNYKNVVICKRILKAKCCKAKLLLLLVFNAKIDSFSLISHYYFVLRIYISILLIFFSLSPYLPNIH